MTAPAAPQSLISGSLIIAGRSVPGAASAEVIDPATGTVIGSAPVSSDGQVDDAVQSAAQAFGPWSALPASKRSAHLAAIATWIRQHAADLATTLTLEQGKPRSEAAGEVDAAAKAFDYYAAEAVRIRGETIPTGSPTLRSIAIRQPIGVAAAIGTWNYPLGIMAWKIAPALAAGCTVVAKAAEQTPLTVLAVVAGAAEAGLPPGVLNSASGPGAQTGARLASHPLVRKISFTGGTATGRRLLHMAADDIKSVTLELGGHSPMIVLADAPLDLAVADAVKRSFRNAGQLCNSVNRVFVQRSVAEQFTDRVAERAARLTLGHGLADPEPDLGPLTTAIGLARVEAHVADARTRGAEIRTGGGRPADGKLASGLFYQPTVVVVGGGGELLMAREETFGPVVPVIVVEDADEAVARANSLNAGLVSYLYTRDLRSATLLSERLEFGTVNINNVGGGDVPFPYAGWKHSGLGVELSREGMEEYLLVKHVRTELGYQ
jgi:succinate-semialdehyde dehydrogenase / glutarate-semialdehyde dehydrogenase